MYNSDDDYGRRIIETIDKGNVDIYSYRISENRDSVETIEDTPDKNFKKSSSTPEVCYIDIASG